MSRVDNIDSSAELLARSPALALPPGRVRYLARMLDERVAALVANGGRARAEMLVVGGRVVPIVINDGDAGDCYLLSPHAHYVRYSREELTRLKPAVLAAGFSALIGGFGVLGRWLRFNRCVSINNWLLSTNPDARLSEEELRDVTDHLRRRHPDHALVFRTVEGDLPEVRRRFEAAGYRLVINRPVHWWYPERWKKLTPDQRKQVRSDLRRFQESGLVMEMDAPLSVAPHLLKQLYEKLYLLKYSRLNADFTAEFFAAAADGFMQLDLVTLEGRAVGFGLRFDDGDLTVLSQVGYDTSLDQRRYPIYRILVSSAIFRSMVYGRRLFLSTGVAGFKQARGSIERIEYEAVYDRHLHPSRRLPWRVIGAIADLAVAGLDTGTM